MSPGPDFLAVELAELVLPMSAGFGLSLPLHELDYRVRAFHLLDGAPLGVTIYVTAYLLVKERGASNLARGEPELLHDCVEIQVHFVTDFGLLVPNVVLVGALPFDCIGPVASHDSVLHGESC